MDEKLIRSLKREPVKYARLLGMDLLTDIHNEWIRMMAFGTEDQTLLGHRGSYKTTCLSFSIALIMILKPKLNIIFLRKTDDDVIEVIRSVAKLLRTEYFRYIVKRLYGIDLVITEESAFKVSTNLSLQIGGTSQLLGIGIKASLTGKHADIVFTDDIVNTRDRVSRPEREQIKLQYMELENVKNRGGRIFNTGTPWHKEDAISIMPNVVKFDCYSTGLITREKLNEIRQKMTDSLFAANYELKHIADKNAMFKEPRFAEAADKIYGGTAHIDASYGGSDGTAYTVFHEAEDGFIYGFGKRWDRHIDDCLQEIAYWHEKLQAGTVACEKNADKGYLARDLEEMGFFVDSYTESMNKFVKISTYLRKNWHRIRWLPETDPEYMAEILDYTEFAEHDDAPDSAASLLRKIEDKLEYNPVHGGI